MTSIFGSVNIGYLSRYDAFYDDVIKLIFFCVTGPLKGIFLSPLDFHNKEPIARALRFLYQPKQMIEQTADAPTRHGAHVASL